QQDPRKHDRVYSRCIKVESVVSGKVDMVATMKKGSYVFEDEFLICQNDRKVGANHKFKGKCREGGHDSRYGTPRPPGAGTAHFGSKSGDGSDLGAARQVRIWLDTFADAPSRILAVSWHFRPKLRNHSFHNTIILQKVSTYTHKVRVHKDWLLSLNTCPFSKMKSHGQSTSQRGQMNFGHVSVVNGVVEAIVSNADLAYSKCHGAGKMDATTNQVSCWRELKQALLATRIP
ncbi:hypothetical protein KI387_000256, partial [Taxus chinensis]